MKTVTEMIERGQWADVGKHVSWWGGKDAEPTCQPRPQATPTRIDAILANNVAVSWIKGFDVIHDEGIPTHRVLQLRLRKKAAMEERTYAENLPSLKKLFENKVSKHIATNEEEENSNPSNKVR